MDRALDAIQMASESIRAAAVPATQERVAELKGLFRTRGGYTHSEIDQAGFELIKLLQQEFAAQLALAKESAGSQLNSEVTIGSGGYTVLKPTSRLPLPDGSQLVVHLSSPEPADARLTRFYGVEVPKDCGVDDDLTLRDLSTNDLFEVRVTSLLPISNTALRMRLSIWVQRLLAELLRELHTQAEKSLRRKGY